MYEQDDNILVQRIIQGDTEAFRGIVERHQNNIFYLGLKFFHNQADAEDFAQEVFLKVFEKLDSFKGQVPFKGWLYKTAFNLAVNKYHLNKRRYLLLQESVDSLIEDDLIADKGESIETSLIKEEKKKEIREILKTMPDAYNVVIKMHYYDGLKLSEIMDILDIPLNTVKSYIFRAKKYIKKMLDLKEKQQ